MQSKMNITESGFSRDELDELDELDRINELDVFVKSNKINEEDTSKIKRPRFIKTSGQISSKIRGGFLQLNRDCACHMTQMLQSHP